MPKTYKDLLQEIVDKANSLISSKRALKVKLKSPDSGVVVVQSDIGEKEITALLTFDESIIFVHGFTWGATLGYEKAKGIYEKAIDDLIKIAVDKAYKRGCDDTLAMTLQEINSRF